MKIEQERLVPSGEPIEDVEKHGDVSEVRVTQAYPVDTTTRIAALIERYRRTERAVPVSFRKLVPWLKIGERATHYLHPYPAKLLPHIAHFFLASKSLCPRDGTVLDPFGGSGTVALETCLSGRIAAYADTNPLARLIAEAKVCIPDVRSLGDVLASVDARYRRSRASRPPAVVNLKKWFDAQVISDLCRLKSAVDAEPADDLRRLLQATFSATVRRVSNADHRLSVPVMAKGAAKSRGQVSVWQRFSEQFSANVRRLTDLQALCAAAPRLEIAGSDARNLLIDCGGSLVPESVDLVITSPPYAGAQKYIRASSLSLGWLGIAEEGKLKPLENLTIGREHLRKIEVDAGPSTSVSAANRVIERIRKKNATRAAICATYLNEMEDVLKQVYRAVKPAGYFVLIIGNNEVCGERFLSSVYLSSMLIEMGFRLELKMVDEIKSRGLMTKRNRTASVITREWVLVFRKQSKC
ncbi:DNA methyltransferase [Burkholderia vietnamiensis]|uniref:DNA methyltransferase n=1 Tax=Burkholderia vietnamiensis TaxID=60552 RepID=UPI002651B0E5|nr:DNA methyltransferase [Burkholderia vietnamiensis]MDN7554285.1 DNA methyltransferase [Burkholderia vietnamiensis]HDR9091999.1 hypothetical protein [Burkholderia vietnamiensis]